MDISKAFPSNYLKADDIGSNRPMVTIREMVVEDIGGEDKPILYFENKEKGLVLNKTNANTIIEMLGTSETDEWIGKRVRLYVTKVEFQGKRVPAIRVDDSPLPAIGTPRRVSTPPPPPAVTTEEVTDDDIPF